MVFVTSLSSGKEKKFTLSNFISEFDKWDDDLKYKFMCKVREQKDIVIGEQYKEILFAGSKYLFSISEYILFANRQ